MQNDVNCKGSPSQKADRVSVLDRNGNETLLGWDVANWTNLICTVKMYRLCQLDTIDVLEFFSLFLASELEV
jgi:hypothetical protein